MKSRWDRTYFGGIERGERNVSINIERIAKGLKIQPFLLLVEADPKDKSKGELPTGSQDFPGAYDARVVSELVGCKLIQH